MTSNETKSAKATCYIMALGALLFGGPAFIWGEMGFLYSMGLFAMLVMVFAVGAAIFMAVFSVLDDRDEGRRK